MKKIVNICLVAVSLFLFASCNEWDPIKEQDGSNAKLVPTHTIQEFLTEYKSAKGDLFPVRPNSGDAGLYSVDTIPTYGKDIVISGRVVSTDAHGNIYKTLFIQDATNPEYGLKVSIDASGLSAAYPIGALIYIRTNGMCVGNYAGMAQLGVKYFNHNSNPDKRGYEPGRMPYSQFYMNSEVVGMPDVSKIIADEVTVKELNDNIANPDWHSRLVVIRNAHFTGDGFKYGNLDPITDDALKIFAPHNDIGYPEARAISDGTGNIAIATSMYAHFANIMLPAPEYTGDIYAIVGYYHDKAKYDSGSAQLTLRGLDDMKLQNSAGDAWLPAPYIAPKN